MTIDRIYDKEVDYVAARLFGKIALRRSHNSNSRICGDKKGGYAVA